MLWTKVAMESALGIAHTLYDMWQSLSVPLIIWAFVSVVSRRDVHVLVSSKYAGRSCICMHLSISPQGPSTEFKITSSRRKFVSLLGRSMLQNRPSWTYWLLYSKEKSWRSSSVALTRDPTSSIPCRLKLAVTAPEINMQTPHVRLYEDLCDGLQVGNETYLMLAALLVYAAPVFGQNPIFDENPYDYDQFRSSWRSHSGVYQSVCPLKEWRGVIISTICEWIYSTLMHIRTAWRRTPYIYQKWLCVVSGFVCALSGWEFWYVIRFSRAACYFVAFNRRNRRYRCLWLGPGMSRPPTFRCPNQWSVLVSWRFSSYLLMQLKQHRCERLSEGLIKTHGNRVTNFAYACVQTQKSSTHILL